MRNIYVISDTHLGHENILKFTGVEGHYLRGQFQNVDQMDDYIETKWNERVKQGDIVYHLGDVFFGPKERFEERFKRFHGLKRLVVGNHDDVPYLVRTGFFQKVTMWRIFKEHGIVLSHVPLHRDSIKAGLVNVHGHIHEKQSPEGPYVNVSCEKIDYTPVHIEELAHKA